MVSFADTFEQQQLKDFAEKAYLDYSMYVILDRALPHIADGLKPVQRRIIYAMSELGLNAMAKYKKSARTVGDCFVKGALVHTQTGLTPIEKIALGDNVLLPNGKLSEVVEVFKNPPQPVVDVELSNGATLTVTDGQLFRVLNDDLSISWERAENLADKNVLVTSPYCLGNASEHPEEDKTALAYILGLFIAEGYLTDRNRSKRVGINMVDVEPLEFLAAYCAEKNIKVSWRQVIPKITHHQLQHCVCSSDFEEARQVCETTSEFKQVPQWILEDRRLYSPFLAGFMDGDGHIRAKTKRREASMASTSPILLTQIQAMLADSGIHGVYSSYPPQKSHHKTKRTLVLTGNDASRFCNAIKDYLQIPKKRKHATNLANAIDVRIANTTAECIPSAAIFSELSKHHLGGGWYQDKNGHKFRAGIKYPNGSKIRYSSDLHSKTISYRQLNEWQILAKLERLDSPLFASLKTLLETYCVLSVENVTRAEPVETFDVQIADESHEFLVQGCAVHNCLGKYHPHGDSACYEAMVLMAQPFSYRYTLVDGQGNWGSPDDPKSFAAMRYTESKLTPYANTLLNEIEQGTVEWVDNFDASLKEPQRLPARLPNILLNGTMGIAVGMATDIPPHNLREIVAACVQLLDEPQTDLETLFTIVHAPDYPTEAEIITSRDDLQKIYRTGGGSLKMRATYTLEDGVIIITALPHQVSGSKLMEQIAAQMLAKKLPMLEDLRDESDHENPCRLLIIPKAKRINAEEIMSHLFATTDLEKSYRVNMNMIGLNGRPQVKNLRDILSEWLEFRIETMRRRLQHRLNKVLARLHILEGLLIAYLNIDEVIAIIRNEDEPKKELIARFGLSEIQAEAILELKLRHLIKLEEIKIRGEQDSLAKERDGLEKTLGSETLLKKQVKKELQQDANVYGDERRSPIVTRQAAQALDETALISNEPLTVILSQKGWIRAAKGHDVDAENLSYRAGDAFQTAVKTRSTQLVYLFDSTGRVYSSTTHDLPSARTQGEPLTGRFNPPDGATFTHLIAGNSDDLVMLVNSWGYGFKTPLNDLASKNKAGKSLVTLSNDENLLPPLLTTREENLFAIATNQGRLLLFPLNEIPTLPRGKGNKLIQIPTGDLQKNTDFIVAFTILKPQSALIISSGKRTLTLKTTDLQLYTGTRAKRGTLLPKGFQRVDALSCDAICV